MAAELATSFVKERATPIFLLSNVTGAGLYPLKTFLNVLQPTQDGRYSVDQPLEISISDVFSVPFVGTCVSGVIVSGQCRTGDTVLLGPDGIGQWTTTTIKSIQRKRVNVGFAEAGQSVSFGLKRVRRTNVRKGMVIIGKTDEPPPKAVRKFEAQVLILYHNTTISANYQAMCHTGCVRQTVRILEIDNHKVLRTGDRATVTLEFISQPEFIKEGWKLLFREGKTKGLGVVTQIFS